MVRLYKAKVYCNGKLIPTAKVYRLYQTGTLAYYDVDCYELYPRQNLVGSVSGNNYLLFRSFGLKIHDKNRGISSNDSKYYTDVDPDIVVHPATFEFNSVSRDHIRVENYE